MGCAARSGVWPRWAERVWPPSEARAQRGRWSEEERSGAKWRGRGLGQRNAGFYFGVGFSA